MVPTKGLIELIIYSTGIHLSVCNQMINIKQNY